MLALVERRPRGRASSKAGESGLVVLNQTPFYGESGGQVGDTGTMTAVDVRVRVADTQKKLGDLFVHHVVGRAGHARRSAIRSSSPSTTPAARRSAPTTRRPISCTRRCARCSATTSRRRARSSRRTACASTSATRSRSTTTRSSASRTSPTPCSCRTSRWSTKLMARRGGDRVRRARALRREVRRRGARRLDGPAPDGEGANRTFSVELCGGTHVGRTGDIGVIAVVSEGAVAAGVRRLEAMTGDAARRHLAAESRKLHEVAGLLKTPVEEAPERLAALIEDAPPARARARRGAPQARHGRRRGGGDPIRDIGGVKLMARAVSGVEMRDLKSLADEGKKRLGSGVVAIVGVAERRQGRHRRRRHRRPDADARRREPRARRRREARRQGRRRPPRHGAGRRSRRRAGRGGARRRRSGARGGVTAAASRTERTRGAVCAGGSTSSSTRRSRPSGTGSSTTA